MTTSPSSPTPGSPVPAAPGSDDALTPAQIEDISAHAAPATVRRAPRYKAFFWVGALVGIAIGVWFGLWVSPDAMINRWIYVLVTVFGTTMVTVLVAGLLAVAADRRSVRRSR